MVRVASRAFFWAMIAGLAHVSVITVRHFVLGGFAWAPREYVWMTPLGYAVVFGVLAVPLMVVALALPRLLSPRLVSFVFAFFASLGVLLLFTGIHSLASIVVVRRRRPADGWRSASTCW